MNHNYRILVPFWSEEVHVLFPDFILRECGMLCDLSRLTKPSA